MNSDVATNSPLEQNVSFWPPSAPLLVALAFAATSIGIFRLFVQGDLMEGGAWFHHYVIHAVVLSSGAALLPALGILLPASFVLSLAAKRWPGLRSRPTRIGLWLAFGAGLYLWGFAASRHAGSVFSDSLWAHGQGAQALLVFALSYLATERVLESLPRRVAWVLATVAAIAWFATVAAVANLDSAYLYRPLETKSEVSPPSFLFLGIDGLDWQIVQQKTTAGEMPHLARLLDEGCSGPLHTLRPTSSPYIWNSIYTGFTPARHALRPSVVALPFGVVFRRTHGPLPDLWQWPSVWLTARGRLQHYPLATWEVMERVGYQTAILGDWTSGPRRQSGLAHVSVAKFPTNLDGRLDLTAQWISPRMASYAAESNLPADAIPPEEWGRFTESGDPGRFLRDLPDEDLASRRTALFRRIYATDRLRFLLGREVLQTIDPPYFVMVYLQSIDIAQHYFLGLREMRESPLDPDFRPVIDRTYEWVDERIGELAESVAPETSVLVVSDHGIDHGFVPDHGLKSGDHNLAPDGVFVMAGQGIHPGKANVHVLDIAPTLLERAGLPLLASLEGRPVCLPENSYPQVVTDWYSMKPKHLDMGDPALLTQEMREILRSLGYSE